jgi:glycosyltransferase involved in cell wall biosynthesis
MDKWVKDMTSDNGKSLNIDVLMSVYAKEKKENLISCFDSLCKQTVTANRVVLVQDGPIPENLLNVIDEYRANLNIIDVVLEQNMGLGSALNFGLQSCESKYVFRMDTDDVCIPERFELQIGALLNDPAIDVLGGAVEEFDETMSLRLCTNSQPLFHDAIYSKIGTRSPFNHPTVAFKLESVVNVGGYHNGYPEDYHLWYRLAKAGAKFHNLSDVLVRMRTGRDFYSRRGFSMLSGELFLMKQMLKDNFISFPTFMLNTTIRCILRLIPSFIRAWVYPLMRRFRAS